MEKISVPDIDSNALYTDILSRIDKRTRKADTIKRAKDDPSKKKEYIFSRYQEYLDIAPEFEKIHDTEGISVNFAKMLEYVFDTDSLFRNTRNRIMAEFRRRYGRCPFCMMSEANTLDHYLNKAKFPEFTLFWPNLVPCCGYCNSKKTESFLKNNKRQFLHYYYDKMPEKPVLLFFYSFDGEERVIHFDVDKSINGYEYDLFRTQFELLDIGLRLEESLDREIARKFKKFFDLCEKYGIKMCFQFINDELKENVSDYGVNHYMSAFYRGLLNDKDKFVKAYEHERGIVML